MTFAFIEAYEETWTVRVLWGALEGFPSGYYSWLVRPPSVQVECREALLVLIPIWAVHAEAKRRYGSPRPRRTGRPRRGAWSANTIAKLRRDNDIRAKTARKFRCGTTDSNHTLPVADNVLARRFDQEFPSEK